MISESTTLLNGLVRLTQSLNGLRASMDSVLLASVVSAKKGQSILDMGCGTGSVGLCVNERLKNLGLSIYGIDIQDEMIVLAQQNAIDNHIGERARYLAGDVHDKSFFKAEEFDHIVMNPPYYKDGERLTSPDFVREKAYTGDFDQWIASALHWVKQGGSVCIIHRADALSDILKSAYGKFGAIEIWPVHSKADDNAIRVIVKMLRNRRTPLTLHPPIVLFDMNGQETSQSKSILRDGAGLI